MRTLRARLVAALLVVVMAGLLALAGITYAEQRSFLYSRVDEQARAAVVAVQRMPDGDEGPDHRPGGAFGDHGSGLPLGTYGELRDAAGAVISGRFLGQGLLGSADLVAPTLPRHPRVGDFQTVASAGARYRVYAEQGADGGLTVVAVPLREVDQNLSRLLLVEGLVVAAVLLLVTAVAWIIVRVGLRPLERIGHTAGRIAAGDLSHRVDDVDDRSEIGRLGRAFNGMLDRLEDAFRRREASEDRARGCPPAARRSSSGSGAPRAAASAERRAPGWGSRSSTASSAPTRATSARRTSRAAARASRWSCRRFPRTSSLPHERRG